MRHLVMDTSTGAVVVQARDRKEYTLEEVADAERRAQAGDPAAIALVASLELDPVTDARELLHDCPECRAAMARGEQPQIFGPDDLAALRRKGTKRWARPPRWRKRKRG